MSAPDHGASDSASPGADPNHWAPPVSFVAAALTAILPFIAALIAWQKGWMPTSDWASVVVRSYDTFSAHPPLVGIYSSATTTGAGTQNVYHPGPLQEWLLAGPIHLFAPSTLGILLGSALLVSACIVTVLVVAWRRGGVPSLCLGTVGMVLFMVATGPAMLREPLHTPLATYAMLAFLVSAWAILDGDRWFWPVAVFFASLACQAQVAFGVPGVIVIVVVAAVQVVAWLRRRRSATPIASSNTVPRWKSAVAITTAGVTLVCWAAPLYDQFFESGNLWALFTTGRDSTPIGPSWALSELAKTLAFPPAWIDRGLHLSVTVTGDTHVVWHTSGLEWVTAACTGAVLVWGLWWTFRRGRRGRISLGVVAVTSITGCFAASSLMPNEAFSLLGHREIWRSAGLVTWWFLTLVIVDVVREVVPRLWRPLRSWGPRLAGSIALVTVLVAGATIISRSSPARDVGSVGFGGVEAFTAAATPACRNGAVAVKPTTLVDTPTALGLIAMLTLRGCAVHAEDLSQILPGPLHQTNGSEPVTFTIDGFDNPPPGCERVAEYDPTHPPPRYRDFSHALERLQRDGPMYLFACR